MAGLRARVLMSRRVGTLREARKIALALPEATEADHFGRRLLGTAGKGKGSGSHGNRERAAGR